MSLFFDVSSEILNPTIFIGQFEIREPITTLTDFLTACVSGLSFVSFYFLNKKYKSKAAMFFELYFLFYFLGMTSAAFLGHALQAYVSSEVKIIGWVFSTIGQLFLALGSLQIVKKVILYKWFKAWHLILICQALIFIFFMIYPVYSNFKIAQLSASVILIGFVLPLHIFNYVKTKSYGSMLIVLIIFYALIPAFIYNKQVSISKWFNYHDISHVLMSIFMLLMFFATRKLSLQKSGL
tara:strand:+ start:10693 stop:11406 length:714 start_codon:yes stop_codon:yes gene_type:complete